MTGSDEYDAVVVGAGPNGLAASVALAQAGRSVLLLEARDSVGGGTRTSELTVPGFLHDVCSAIHPVGAASPFFRSLDLAGHGLEWVHSPTPLAHPLDDGTAVVLERSVGETAGSLGADGAAYRRLMQPLVDDWEVLVADVLGPLRLPRHPFAYLRFGRYAARSARGLAQSTFTGERARALFAGLGAHSVLPLERAFSAGIGLVIGSLGHAVGWPIARGGSQRIADALEARLASLGGQVQTGVSVDSLEQLPRTRATLLDVTPRQLLSIGGNRLSEGYRRALQGHRYGPGVFKVDWALDGPIPWKALECRRAATVHIGGTIEEISASESAVWRGDHADRPFVILAQQSLFDPTRAPSGKHTAWGYCHVPNGSSVDMTGSIERQIERFAPGFRERVLARSVKGPAALEEYNANNIGGDISGGAQDFWQLFARPALRRGSAYSAGAKGLYLCSASTPPGGGVHGMCGYCAAQAALSEAL